MSKKRLGKGLGALLPDDEPINVVNDNCTKVVEVDIDEIEPNPFQPRRQFDENQLKELSESIKENGIIQPISVRKIGDKYQLVAGERRLRASKLAQLTTIPAIEKNIDDRQMMELALIENLQREDLNPIEEALAYQQLIEQFNLTQEEVAKRIGKSRAAVANMIRLLNLPTLIQEYVSRETIYMGHARALLGLDTEKEMLKVCEKCISEKMSVRQLEDYINFLKKKDNSRKKKRDKDPLLEQLRNNLEDKFGTRVKFGETKNNKTITIECKSNDDFQRVLDILGE